MNSTMSLPFTSLSMNCSIPMADLLIAPKPVERPFGAPDQFRHALTQNRAIQRQTQGAGARSRKVADNVENSSRRDARLQSERMELASHLGFESVVDELVLLDPRLAPEH